MSENQHHTRATSRLHNGTTNEVARAQAEATLALAYEQRTANLIALWSNPQATALNSDSTWSVDHDDLGKLLQMIQDRLAL
jgi:hypothetical protein